MSTKTSVPAFRAFSVSKRDGKTDYWTAIGAAFPHEHDGGFNILLHALPVDGKIVLRPFKESDEEHGTAKSQK